MTYRSHILDPNRRGLRPARDAAIDHLIEALAGRRWTRRQVVRALDELPGPVRREGLRLLKESEVQAAMTRTMRMRAWDDRYRARLARRTRLEKARRERTNRVNYLPKLGC